MYGLKAFVLPPPLGPLVALLLIVGCDAAGLFVSRFVFRFGVAGDPAWQCWQAPAVGAATLSLLLYPLALLGWLPAPLLRAVAVLLAVLGVVHLGRRAVRVGALLDVLRRTWAGSASFERFALLLTGVILGGLGLIALSPVTNADSLDYHVGVALSVVRDGAMPVQPEWFHGRLAAAGEVLNALGLAVGAEAFGALLQFTGLVCVIAMLVGVCREVLSEPEATRRGLLLALATVSTPVLLFLATAPK